MNAFKKDFLIYSSLCIVFLLILLVLIPVGIEPPVEGIGEVAVTPSTWPTICTMAILCFFAGLTVTTYRQWQLDPEAGPGESVPVKPVLISFLVFFLYYLSVPYLGFTCASGLFAGLYAWLCGVRNKPLLALIAVVIPGALYLFFYYVAQVPMPTGPLGFV